MSRQPLGGKGRVESTPSPLAARIASSFELTCPSCGGVMIRTEIWFAGMPILAEYRCADCAAAFLVDWPAGHALLHPTMLRIDTGDVYFDGAEWYPRALQSLVHSRSDPVTCVINVTRRAQQRRTALIVNCIDYVYGHCILKLLSAMHYLSDLELDAIVIVPKNIAWLVPVDAAAVVEVDVALRDARRWIDGLDATVKELVQPYEHVRIAPTPSQPALSRADISSALRRSPLDLWNTSEEQAQVTIALREDRTWSTSSRWVEKLQLERLIPARIRKRLGIARQNRRFATVVRQVHAVLPDTRVVLVGQGRTGRVRAAVTDLRRVELTATDELEWLREYERTSVLIGVHGSHMLVPSALAGAVIDLLPPSKLPNITQDLVVARDDDEDPKLLLFRHRIIPTRTTPETISEMTVSLLNDRRFHHRNVIENQKADGTDWVRAIDWHLLPAARPD